MTLFCVEKPRMWLLAVVMGLLPWLAACQDKTIASSVVGHNHTDRGIVFSLPTAVALPLHAVSVFPPLGVPA